MTQENKNEYRGFNLFTDVADEALRKHNQAMVLANIAVDYMSKKTKMVSPKGAALILGYFQQVTEKDRADVQEVFKQAMTMNGFKLQ